MNAVVPTAPEQRLLGKGSPFELVAGEFRNAPRSLADLYAKYRVSDSQVLISHDGMRLTGRQVFKLAGDLARRLVAQFGIGPGKNVAIVLPNGPEWLIAFIAISSMGASAVVVHMESGGPAITRAISRSRCSLVITREPMMNVLKGRLADCPLYAYEIAPPNFEADVTLSFDEVEPESIAVVAHTSGSTGEPKQVLVSHRALMHGVLNTMLASALAAMRIRQGRSSPGARPVSLLVAPLSHVSGYLHFLTMLRVGGTVVTTASTDAGSIASLIAENSVSSLVGAQPDVIRNLIRKPAHIQKLGSLRSLGVQGTSLSTDLLNEIVAALPLVTVASGYGLTETCGLIALAAGSELLTRPKSCGRVIPSVEIQVVNGHEMPVPESEVGEIWIRGRMLASGYAEDGAENTDRFRAGWFRTGDAGCIDGGFLYVIGRVNGSGEYRDGRAALANLESLALDVGPIDEAAAVDLLDAHGEARPVVAVVRKAGCGLDLESLRRRVQMHAGDSARVVELLNLPRTPTGKVDRTALCGVLGNLQVSS